MAARKELITQTDFTLGAIRPEVVERSDTPLVTSSLRECVNTITLSTGQVEQRPGLVHLSAVDSEHSFEVVMGEGRIYDLHILENGLAMFDAENKLVAYHSSLTWVSVPNVYGSPSFDDLRFWVQADPDGNFLLIGSQHTPVYKLAYVVLFGIGSWKLTPYGYSANGAGAMNIPFWRHHSGVEIAPSALTGAITVTANSGIWEDGHVGCYIRYVDRQILITSKVSSTVVNAEVVEELPPTYDLTVGANTGFQIGDAVEASVSGGQGIIVDISGTTITVLATSLYTEFVAGTDKLVGPNASSAISARAAASSPSYTALWDLQLWNPVFGYAGTAARHVGRMFLSAFPSLPNAFCSSAAQDITDFSMGPNDGDGFAESLSADTGGAIKHLVSAEDLLFFTSNGLYYQLTRNGDPITPENIKPIRFSRLGCGAVRPVAIDDGAVFVDSTGTQVNAAVLAGDIYRSWRVEPVSKYAPHLIETPVHLGATAAGADRPEMMVVVTNSDGTMAVAQWDRAENVISWRPWITNGEVKRVFQVYGKLMAVVDRDIGGSTVRFRERFEYGAYLDCMSALYVTAAVPFGAGGAHYLATVTAPALHLAGEEAAVYFENFDMGDMEVGATGWPVDDTGSLLTYPDGIEGFAQVGMAFSVQIVPWSRRSVKTFRGMRNVKRLVQLGVTVQSATSFKIDGDEYGAFEFGEDLTSPPPLRNLQQRVTRIGADAYERVEIVHDRPGPFRLLKLEYKVVI